MSQNHEGYERAMEDVLHILNAHGLLTQQSGFDGVGIAVARLRAVNRQLMKEAEEQRCESEIYYGFESRSYRCTKRRGHGGEHVATVGWNDGVFGTSSGEEE